MLLPKGSSTHDSLRHTKISQHAQYEHTFLLWLLHKLFQIKIICSSFAIFVFIVESLPRKVETVIAEIDGIHDFAKISVVLGCQHALFVMHFSSL